MIKYLEGDIFSSPAQTIVNTVNTVGVMGKGIALEFKKRYPNMFDKYKTACEKKKLKVESFFKIFVDEENDWTVYTADLKPSAQWEVELLVTETGYELLCW